MAFNTPTISPSQVRKSEVPWQALRSSTFAHNKCLSNLFSQSGASSPASRSSVLSSADTSVAQELASVASPKNHVSDGGTPTCLVVAHTAHIRPPKSHCSPSQQPSSVSSDQTASYSSHAMSTDNNSSSPIPRGSSSRHPSEVSSYQTASYSSRTMSTDNASCPVLCANPSEVSQELQLPGLLTMAVPELVPFLGPTCLILSSSAVLLILLIAVPRPSVWYAACHVGAVVLAIVWLFVAETFRTCNLLRRIVEAIPKTISNCNPSRCVSADCRVRFVLMQIHEPHTGAAPQEEASESQGAAPLHFLRDDLETWEDSDHAYTVIDSDGVVLWANAAMCRHFGYGMEELIGSNVCILMPSPYAEQHDHFLKRYRDTGVGNMIGTERAVPVLTRDGRQRVVLLSVVQQCDPNVNGAPRLFSGRMKFDATDPIMSKFPGQEPSPSRLVPPSSASDSLRSIHSPPAERQSGSDPAMLGALQGHLCALLNQSIDAVIVCDARDTIRFWSPTARKLFGWDCEEAIGQPLTLILPHVTEAGRQDSKWCLSNQGPARGITAVSRAGEILHVDLNTIACPCGLAVGTLFVVYLRSQSVEQQKSCLLLDNFPLEIMERLLVDPSRPITERHNSVSIIFADVVGFTALTSDQEPEAIVQLLTSLTTSFDMACEDYEVTKIKSIGDGFLAVAGVPKEVRAHADRAIDFGLAVISMPHTVWPDNRHALAMRVGINTGPVVAGVIGVARKSYDVWGDAVNVASRMESNGQAGSVLISESTHNAVRNRAPYSFKHHTVHAKGKGMLQAFFVQYKASANQMWMFCRTSYGL